MASKHYARAFAVLMTVATTVVVADDALVPRLLIAGSYSDNVDRALTNEKSDLIYSGNVGLAYKHETSAVSADLDTNYLYYGYARNSFPSEGLFGFDGVVDWRIVPQAFSWYFEDQYGQIASRPFGALTPASRENVNYLTTGPTLRLGLGSTSALNVRALYSNSSYGRSNIDSDRYAAALQLLHLPSETRTISLNLEHTKVAFRRSALYPDYDTDKGYVRLESTARQISIEADAGVMSTDNGVTRKSQPLLGLTAYRLVGAFSMLGVDYRQGYSDSAESFRFDERGANASTGDRDVLVQASAFRERRISTFLSLAKPRTFGRVSVFYSEEQYTAVSGADRDVRGADMELGYQLSSKVSFKGYLRYEKLHQPALGERDTDKLFGVELQQQLTRSSGLQLLVERYDRDSNIAQAFVENRISLTWRYQPQSTIRGSTYDPYRGRGLRQPLRPTYQESEGPVAR